MEGKNHCSIWSTLMLTMNGTKRYKERSKKTPYQSCVSFSSPTLFFLSKNSFFFFAFCLSSQFPLLLSMFSCLFVVRLFVFSCRKNRKKAVTRSITWGAKKKKGKRGRNLSMTHQESTHQPTRRKRDVGMVIFDMQTGGHDLRCD